MRLQNFAQRIGNDICTGDEALGAGRNVGDDHGGAPRGAFGIQRFEDIEAHEDLVENSSSSWRWTKQSVPPFPLPRVPGRGSSGRGSARFAPLLHLLDVDPDSAAAGKADLPCGIVGDPKFQHFRLAGFNNVDGFGHHRAFDAAARHRAEKISILVDDEVGADWSRRRAPGLDHCGKRDIAPLAPPVLGGLENVFVAREHLGVSRFSLYKPEYRKARRWGQWL